MIFLIDYTPNKAVKQLRHKGFLDVKEQKTQTLLRSEINRKVIRREQQKSCRKRVPQERNARKGTVSIALMVASRQFI